MPGVRFRVQGGVQGVGFRAATRARALALGVHGAAINLGDGAVEVRASGSTAALEALEAWLRQGPPTARVLQVDREAWHGDVPPGFVTG